ncbi:MAG TPA: glycosyltransferase [Gemmatimonadaceae bacterium]|nr:glycosyltransferase [Gemmatimonadaceae bacterium]
MNVLHLTDSPFFGGPERQILGLARALPSTISTTVLCFREHASCVPFLAQLKAAGVASGMLESATPAYPRMLSELRRRIRDSECDLLVCHGYKADILGLIAARTTGTPVVSVSRGWTGHTRKVRLNEALDRRFLRFMDAVVCVSEGQAVKVRRCGVPAKITRVIHNAIDPGRFGQSDRRPRETASEFFARPIDALVIAVGRLSPEKGFDDFIAAAQIVLQEAPDVGFLLIGDGPLRSELQRAIDGRALGARVVLTGFRDDVDRILSDADILVQTSHTEGLPNVILEAAAAQVPVVATAVGGTPEVVADGQSGYLVPPRDTAAIAERLLELLRSPELRSRMGSAGRKRVQAHFSFARQSADYLRLFEDLAARG